VASELTRPKVNELVTSVTALDAAIPESSAGEKFKVVPVVPVIAV
jgi:hypothetical protein